MKYIKTYEKYKFQDIKDVEKYIVFLYKDFDKEEYYIDTITNITKKDNIDIVEYTMLYKYDYKTQKLDQIATNATSKSSVNEYLKDILFTSDNLEECLQFINTHSQTIKFNI